MSWTQGALTSDSQPDEELLESLIARCIEALPREGRPVVEEVCREHPALAEQLRARLARLAELGLLAEIAPATSSEARRVGDFTLLHPIGGGGMGMVYLARQERLGRVVALKLIHPDLLHFPGVRERFQREIEIVARLQHPAIVPIYTVGEDFAVPHFAMERIEGCSLAQALQDLQGRSAAGLTGGDLARTVARRAGWDPARASTVSGGRFHGSWADVCAEIIRTVAEALAHVHEHGVLHRDVKPSNVLLTPDGRVLLTDFGLAAAEGSDALTHNSSQLGSLPYMPPEQLRGDAGFKHDQRCDVYSLGVTFYEALALQAAFAGDAAERTRQRIRDGRPTPLRRLNGAIPRDLETICAKAMETDPARRYASAADLAADLRRYAGRHPILARAAGPLLRLRRFSQRHPAVSVAAVITGVAFVAFGLRQQADLRRADGMRLIVEARAQRDLDPCLALLLAIEGAERSPGATANTALLEALDANRERRLLYRSDAASRHANVAEFSPRGDQIASGHAGGIVSVWSAASGERLHRLEQPGNICFLGYDAAGLQLQAIGGSPGRWTAWNTVNWERIAECDLPGDALALDAIHGLAVILRLSGDEASDPTFELWDLYAGAMRTRLEGPSGAISRAVIDPGGRFVLLIPHHLESRSVLLLDAASGAVVRTIGPHDGAAWDAAFSPDGTLLATATDAETIWLWPLEDEQPPTLLRGHAGGVFRVRFSPNGRHLVSTSQEDATVRVWDVASGKQIALWRRSGAELQATAFDAEGTSFVTTTQSGALHLWTLDTMTRICTLEQRSELDRYGRFSPDGTRLATVRGNGGVHFGSGRLWEVQTGALLAEWPGEGHSVATLEFDSKSAGVSGALRKEGRDHAAFWDARNGAFAPERTMEMGPSLVEGIRAISPDGDAFATASHAGLLEVVMAGRASLERETIQLDGVPVVMRFDPDAIRLACILSVGDSNDLILHQLGERQWLWRVRLPALLDGLRFSDDGERLLAYGQEAWLYDVATGDAMARLEGHEDQILGGCFSQDGRWVATASADRTARLWALPGGTLHAVMRGHERAVLDVCFPDPARVLTASNDGTMRSWPVDPLGYARAHQPRRLTAAERRVWLDGR